MKMLKFLSFIFIVLVVSGCATVRNMALSPQMKGIDTAKESIVLITLKASNEYKPTYQPFVLGLGVRTQGSPGKRKLYGFNIVKPFRTVKHKFNEYLLSLKLPPGDYQTTIFAPGRSGFFPVRGNFIIPLYLNFTLKADEVVYMGRIEANNRERKNDDELRAGPIIPLIDQAVTGFGNGTFDINIYDNYDNDIKDFTEAFPYLSSVQINKAILPPWKKPSPDDMKRR